jgi:hypothetical protein
MKIIKTFEEWSPKFNRTLQGAAALATSTNKGFGKAAKSIEYFANRSISKEEFKIVEESTASVKTGTFVHDPKFILKPIEQFSLINKTKDNMSFFSIPLIMTEVEYGGRLAQISGEKKSVNIQKMITFTSLGVVSINDRSGDWSGLKNNVRFLDRASIENFIAMAIQAITSSPEPGTPVESQDDGTGWGSAPVEKGMTKEKQDILDLIQKIVLDKDMRSFTM